MYNSYLKINDDFKSSINLTYDLGNENKIRQYVITDSICECLEKYIDSFLNNDCKSTYITGPYGKGKSYLLLVLTYIFSKKSNKTIFNEFLKKIKKYNVSLAKKIEAINNENVVMLPVIVNNNASNSLINNFRIALKEALLRSGITDLVMHSSYSAAINQINAWQNNEEASDIFSICKNKLKIDIGLLKKGLENYSEEALENFKNLYLCITRGANFNPLINDDIATLFEDTAIAIKDKGYRGIVVLYDEFGMFLENKTSGFSKDLNIIQGFAEKCNSSKIDSQIHIVLIAHKDLLLYNNEKKYNDSFEKIVGRFKEYNFSRSFEENYSTLLSSYEITDEEYFNKELEKHNHLIQKIKALPIFGTKEINYIEKYYLPFNPLAIYALVRVSKLVGQNERTLFTFMSDSGMYSFSNFISHNDTGLINTDYIYDYFADSIYLNGQYNALYNQVHTMLQSCKNQTEFKIVKALAIIKIINEDVVLRSTKDNIVLSLGVETEEDFEAVMKGINDLLNRNVLKESVFDKTISFGSIFDTVILTELLKAESKVKNDAKTEAVLTEINTEKYVFSNQYNFENKMIRFMKVIYLNYSSLDLIDDFYGIIKTENADGVIVRVTGEIKDREKTLNKLNRKYENQPVIFRLYKDEFDKKFQDRIVRLKACNNILNHKNKLDELKINMLNLYKNELIIDINNYLNKLYDCDGLELQAEINEKFSLCYPRTIQFNNEQVNRKNVSKITEKSRNAVIDCILNNIDVFEKYNRTSQEATIYSIYNDAIKRNNSNFIKLVQEIKSLFINSDNVPVDCKKVIEHCISAKSDTYLGYGVREGIIPIVLASAIASLSIQDNKSLNTILLYYKNREISLDSTSLSKLTLNPESYYFVFKKINCKTLQMIEELIKIFNLNQEEISFKYKIYELIAEIKKYILSLPRTITNISLDDNIIRLSFEAIRFKNLFLQPDLNSYDIILNKLPEIFGGDCCHLENKVRMIRQEYNQSYENFIKNMIKDTIKYFHKKATSIKSAFELFVSEYPDYRKRIYDDLCRDMIKIMNNSRFDDKECINQLSSAVVGSTLDDFNDNKKNNYFTAINVLIKNIKSSNSTDVMAVDKTELSTLGKTLFNNVLSALNEYGSSVSNAEKALVLNKALEEVRGL